MSTIAPSPATAAPGKPAIRQSVFMRIRHTPMALISLIALLVIVFAVVAAPLLTPFNPNSGDISNALLGPNPEHLLGTDSAGRDVFARILYGGRNTLGGAVLALVVAAALGVTTGLIAGYHGGKVDTGLDWYTNLVIAIPNIMVLLAVRAAWGSNIWVTMTFLGILMAPGYHRLVRGISSGVRNELYVDAARVSGLSLPRILGRHILVAIRAPIIIFAALNAVVIIGVQAGLDFLGLGDTTVPTWGNMLNEALVNLYVAPGLMLWPGLALGLINAALILFGNGLRDALEDTKTAKRRSRRRGNSASGQGDGVASTPQADATLGGFDGDTRAGAGTAVAGAAGCEYIPDDTVLAARNLNVGYPSGDGGYKLVVKGVSFGVRRGEILGLVGESGSGKTQTAWACLDLLPSGGKVVQGSITVAGKDLGSLSKRERRGMLGKSIAYIPQEPMSNLDPSFKIGYQLVEPLRQQLGLSKKEARENALSMLAKVGIADPERTFNAYPHQISGGMAQRVLIAGAVSCNPAVLIADEPTTALDVTVQAEVLDLLRGLQQETGMAVILVTHNFGVVADLCDRVAVMQLGKIVEQNDVETLFSNPQHPYTRMLLGAGLEDKTPRTRLMSTDMPALQEAKP